MVYSGSNLIENPQSYGAAQLKGRGFFKTGTISGRFATFFLGAVSYSYFTVKYIDFAVRIMMIFDLIM